MWRRMEVSYSAKFRRPRCLVIAFSQEGPVVYNYLKNTHATVSHDLLRLLLFFDSAKTVKDVSKAFSEWNDEEVCHGVRSLLDHHFLIADQDEYDARIPFDSQLRNDDMLFFHLWTRDDFADAESRSLLQRGDGRWVQIAEGFTCAEELRADKAPPPFKRYSDARRIFLPRDFISLKSNYEETLIARRTIRNFGAEPVGLREFSTLLHFVFGPMRVKDDNDFGVVQVKTSPAGGSRHELECYLGVLNVHGVPRGIYHYCGIEHSLELLQDEYTPEMAVESCTGQAWVADVGAVFYLCALFERFTWKYRSSIAYRAMLLNAGFLGQTFALTTTTLGLGPFQTIATKNALVEEWLGLDPLEESLMLTTACGTLRAEDRMLHDVPSMNASGIPLVQNYSLPKAIHSGK
jgi:SagB-type dehydrogenase family enzyme